MSNLTLRTCPWKHDKTKTQTKFKGNIASILFGGHPPACIAHLAQQQADAAPRGHSYYPVALVPFNALSCLEPLLLTPCSAQGHRAQQDHAPHVGRSRLTSLRSLDVLPAAGHTDHGGLVVYTTTKVILVMLSSFYCFVLFVFVFRYCI